MCSRVLASLVPFILFESIRRKNFQSVRFTHATWNIDHHHHHHPPANCICFCSPGIFIRSTTAYAYLAKHMSCCVLNAGWKWIFNAFVFLQTRLQSLLVIYLRHRRRRCLSKKKITRREVTTTATNNTQSSRFYARDYETSKNDMAT